MIQRIVVKVIEAWDATLAAQVVINSGTVVRVNQIVFDKPLGPGMPRIVCAVEFESNGALYYAPFGKFQEATGQEAPEDENRELS
jgi:hypothetical protein